MHRPGYKYCEAPGGGWIGVPAGNHPDINWRHIDGPMLVYADGQLHWLTLLERLCCWLGISNAFTIERRRRPDLAIWYYDQ